MTENGKGINIDLDELYNKKFGQSNNGKSENGQKKYTLEELRNLDIEDALMERFRNKGKMSFEDMLKWDFLERRMNKKDEPQQNPIDIESVIEKATAPFKEQIAEMKRQQEAEKQERKFEALNTKIDTLLAGGMKKDDPVIEELKSLRQQLSDEKEKAAQRERENFQDQLMSHIDALDRRIDDMRRDPNASKSDIERIIETKKKEKEILDALGVKRDDSKEDDASVIDTVDAIASKAPSWMKTVNTIREGFKGGEDIQDDIPMDVPTNLPERQHPRTNRSEVPDDIRDFLSRGHENEDGAFVDISGTPWTNGIDGSPIPKASIEQLAITDPEQVRRIMEETYAAIEQERNKKRENPKPAPKQEEIQDDIQDDVHATESTPEPVTTQDDVHVPTKDEDKHTEPEPPVNSTETGNRDYLDEAMRYINQGDEQEDENGNMAWVGPKGEAFKIPGENDKYHTRQSLIREAESDPEQFVKTVLGE